MKREVKKEFNIKGEFYTIEDLFISAVRYALGRRTYIVQEHCETVLENIDFFSKRALEVMIRDIEECDNYGWDCDKQSWMTLLNKLKKKLEEKKNGKK